MKLAHGLWLPDIMSGPAAYLRRAETLPAMIERARERRVAVQAGGHIGIYPAMLSKNFERVYTFEPEAENFACLARNADAPNVWAARGFLSDTRELRALRQHSKSTGGHKTGGTLGADMPSYRIDDMQLDACSAIFLDVEGWEMPALRGAEQTIRRCHPLIVAEENRQCLGYGFTLGALERYLANFSYAVAARVAEDVVFQREARK